MVVETCTDIQLYGTLSEGNGQAMDERQTEDEDVVNPRVRPSEEVYPNQTRKERWDKQYAIYIQEPIPLR